MLLFKTSGATIKNVVLHKKHALHHEPSKWKKNEILLISENKRDCVKGEKQIAYLMVLESISKLKPEEIKKYWPESSNNWQYLVSCSSVLKLKNEFDLKDIIGHEGKPFDASLKPKKILPEHEKKITAYLRKYHPKPLNRKYERSSESNYLSRGRTGWPSWRL